MNETLLALSGYIVWTMLLLLLLASYRISLVLGQKRSLKFQSDGSDVPERGKRITRAYLNAVESFAFIGGLMLLAIATGAMAITNPLAYILLGARICQSVVHIISTRPLFIQIRFAFFLIQFLICAYWVIMLIQRFTL